MLSKLEKLIWRRKYIISELNRTKDKEHYKVMLNDYRVVEKDIAMVRAEYRQVRAIQSNLFLKAIEEIFHIKSQLLLQIIKEFLLLF